MTTPSLQAAGLAGSAAGRRLFAPVDFTLQGGAALRIAGPNGIGKTHLLRLLCGLGRPDAGAIFWQGQPIGSVRERYLASLAYVGHADALNDHLNCWENLAFGRPGAGCGRAAAIAALKRFEMDGKAGLPVRALSRGQRRRVALARLALALDRPLWLLDEPFGALDEAAQQALTGLLERHRRDGGIVVYTTHQSPLLSSAATVSLEAA